MRDNHIAKELVKFFVVANRKLQMARDDPAKKKGCKTGLANGTGDRTDAHLCFLLSLAAFPASSRISAARYSRTAARYTGAPAPMRLAYWPFFKRR